MVERRREKLTVWKSQAFNASAASTVLSISPITCLARLIKTASAVPFSAEKLMRNDYFLCKLQTMKFYLIQSFSLEVWMLNIEKKFSFFFWEVSDDGNRWLNGSFQWASSLKIWSRWHSIFTEDVKQRISIRNVFWICHGISFAIIRIQTFQ